MVLSQVLDWCTKRVFPRSLPATCSEGHVQVVIINNVPLFFQERDGPWCPTLRVLHQYPDMMKKLRADKVPPVAGQGLWVLRLPAAE